MGDYVGMRPVRQRCVSTATTVSSILKQLCDMHTDRWVTLKTYNYGASSTPAGSWRSASERIKQRIWRQRQYIISRGDGPVLLWYSSASVVFGGWVVMLGNMHSCGDVYATHRVKPSLWTNLAVVADIMKGSSIALNSKEERHLMVTDGILINCLNFIHGFVAFSQRRGWIQCAYYIQV